MLVDIEKFIYSNKIYSKCNVSDKEMIDTCLHSVRQQIETFKEAYNQVQEEIALLKRENKALADDNELKCELNEELTKENKMLKQALGKTCNVLSNNLQKVDIEGDEKLVFESAEIWKEWALNDDEWE
jgi:hypothetical protein